MNRLIPLTLAVLLLVGCSTVTRGTKQGVKFQSEPSGATATIVRVTGDQT